MYYTPLVTKHLRFRSAAERHTHDSTLLLKYLNEHKYEFTSHDIEEVFSRPIYLEIIFSQAFQRLKKIHFLGSIDYLINPEGSKPNKRHTRYQHSLGVALLALQYSKYRQLTPKEEILCVSSALLHDIGHAPLSHSMEPVLKDYFYLNHHLASTKIIQGSTTIGEELHRILLKWDINPSHILDIIEGTESSRFYEAFGLSINIDTIEAILRSQTYIYPNHLSATPSTVLKALITRSAESTRVLDTFWLIKDEIYNKLINSNLGVLADHICQEHLKKNISKYGEDLYFKTEDDFKKIEPRLFKFLSKLSGGIKSYKFISNNSIPFTSRNFVINHKACLTDAASINSRYCQHKTKRSLSIRESIKSDGSSFSPKKSLSLL
ncbi:MAG: HD domain-containing protein [Candidatus Thiodiazotropha sp. (ex Cardiolucina cf. quadrata)]|nr:HD domain-containing protein [Candidatus Thiodiazotropha sp. (ex Cardiolucina cf. quadrata)]